MPMVQLTLEALKELDNGRVWVAFDHELKRAVLDCLDRPGDTKSREVSMIFKITPVIDETGNCDEVKGNFKIKSKVPDRQTKNYEFRANKKGHLVYSSNSPENIDQTTIDDVGPDGRIRR